MFRKRVDIDLENVNSNMLEIVMCICDSLNCESKKLATLVLCII